MAPTHQADWSPNDWPDSLPEMRTIDNLLRCSICYEFFDTAVLIKECSHNYCSHCIRQAITFQTQCPTCLVKTAGNDLKCNRVLDELVKNFVNVRSKLLEMINKSVIITNVPNQSDNEMSDDSMCRNFVATPKRMTPSSKKNSSKGKSPRRTPRNKRKRQKMVDLDSEVEVVPLNDGTSKQEMAEAPGNIAESTSGAVDVSNFVECPACGEMMDNNLINSHLDVCLTREEKKSTLRCRKELNTNPLPAESHTAAISSRLSSTQLMSPLRLSSKLASARKKALSNTDIVTGSNAFISSGHKRKPISGIVYAILSDKHLKLKLKEWNLSTQGDRQTLIKRHQEFVIAYNSQCDSTNPKSAPSIVKELEIREKRRMNLANSISVDSNLHSLNKDSSEKEVDNVHQNYIQKHQPQFDQLISEARKKQLSSTTEQKSKQPAFISIDEQDSNKPTASSELLDEQQKNKEVKNNEVENNDEVGITHSDVPGVGSSNCTPDKNECFESVMECNPYAEDSMDFKVNGNVSPENNSRQGKANPESIVAIAENPEQFILDIPDPPSPSCLDALNTQQPDDDDDSAHIMYLKCLVSGAQGVVNDADGANDDDMANDDNNMNVKYAHCSVDNNDANDDVDDDKANDVAKSSVDNNGDDDADDSDLTPAFGLPSSNEEESYTSDVDLFATELSPVYINTSSLRRRKK